MLGSGTGCLDAGMDIASLAVACVSAFAAVWAVWYARAQKRIAKQALAESARSADAAEKSAKEATRSADAAAEMTEIERGRRADELAAVDAARAPRLVLEPEGRYRFLLVNRGGSTAANIALNFGTLDLGGVRWEDGVTLAPRESAPLWMRPPGVSLLPAQIQATWDGAAQPSTIPVPGR